MASDLSNFEVQVIRKTFQLHEDASIQVDIEHLKNAGFCSTLKTANLNGKFSVILKCAPTGSEIREVIPFAQIFQREIYFYDVVVQIFEKLQKEYGVVLWNCVPKCFYSSKEPSKEVLVLDNLITQEFLLWPREKQMNSEHLKIVLKGYAKLHAFSFALRMHKPEVLQEIETNTKDIYLPIIKRCGTAETIRKLSARVWKAYGVDNCNFPIIEEMERLTSQGAAGRYGVLCHGDTWCNNILFKYKNCSDQPVDLKFVDFQLARFGSPVLDLSYFLYCSATLNDLQNLEELLMYYHNELSRFLEQLRCDVSVLFPYNVLEAHWKKFAKFGLGMACLVVNVMTMDDTELPDVNANKTNGDDFIGSFQKKSKNDERYLGKMVGILKHFEERRLL